MSYKKSSSCIIDLAFSPSLGLLITFPQGDTYGYDIEVNLLPDLVTAESMGRFYNRYIKHQSPCKKFGKKSIGQILSMAT